jgi:hypothetical protein
VHWGATGPRQGSPLPPKRFGTAASNLLPACDSADIRHLGGGIISGNITPASTLDSLKAEARRWRKALKQRLAAGAPLRRDDRVAEALVAAYHAEDDPRIRIVWQYFGPRRVWPAMRRYVRLELGRTEEPERPGDDTITLDEARLLVARAQGFESWAALAAYAGTVPPGSTTIAEKAVVVAEVDAAGEHTVAGRIRDRDAVIAALRQRKLEGLGAMGQMTDALLDRNSRVGHLRVPEHSGSKGLTDAGLRHLGRLPRLRALQPGVTSHVATTFGPGVRVRHSI